MGILLIVDDDNATRLLIKNILREEEIKIIETGCGVEAFELFQNNSKEISLVILDIILPGFDGWILVKKFKELDPRVPVIAVSAIPPQELDLRCRKEGFKGYFSKPLHIKEFRQFIFSIINKP
jgi:DNA-binding response OmpR family regulator